MMLGLAVGWVVGVTWALLALFARVRTLEGDMVRLRANIPSAFGLPGTPPEEDADADRVGWR